MAAGYLRNVPCPCGSGKKYKACCLAKDTAKATAARSGDAAVLAAKAEAYDCLAQIQQWQQRLDQANRRVMELLGPQPTAAIKREDLVK